uniref:Probable G-protein coupled receptor 33 n=1 Tax=Terrapene triunguis TaxID=2587831 RepID=A0A674JHT6_9SAUR
MDQGNTTLQPITGANSRQTPAAMRATHLAAAMLLFTTLPEGVVGNRLYLRVLGLKMRRTVTTLWFLHLASCYFLFTLLIPFFTVYLLLDFHWVFGTAMCKLLNACISMDMFSSVFLLALISLDRYTLTCHPIWSQHHRTLAQARKLAAGVWLVSFALSTPYLAFRDTHVDEGRITCIDNYTLSRNWNGAETQDLGRRVHLAIFTVQFLLGFLLPFCTITGCYVCVGLELKEKGLAQSGKPFKVMVAAVVSFFLCWLPYHLYYALMFYRNVPQSVTGSFLVIFIIMFCFNVCFTPVLYLFVGGTFQQVARTSLFALVKAAFDEDLSSDGSGPESSRRPGPEIDTMEMEKNLESCGF